MITLKVIPDNGEAYVVTATSRDVLTWEKTTKGGRSFVDLLQSPTLVDFYRVAHIASWRQGLTTAKNLQEFEATCEVEGIDDEEDGEPDPTQSGQSPENSSTSPSEPESPRPSGRKRATAQL